MGRNIRFFGNQDDIPIQEQRKLALYQSLINRGSDTSPVQHPYEGLARIGQAITGKYQSDKLEQGYDQRQQEKAAAMAEALRKGRGEVNPETGQREGGGIDPMIEALGATNPQMATQLTLQQMAMEQEQEQKRKQMEAEQQQWQQRNQMEPIMDDNGNVLGQRNVATGEVKADPRAVKTDAQMQQLMARAKASAAQNNNTVVFPQQALNEKLAEGIGKNLAEDVDELEPKAVMAKNGLEDTARIKDLLNKGMYTGFGAEVKLTGGKILSAVTGKPIPEIANTEEYKRTTGKMALDLLSTVTLGALSKDEQVWLKDVAGGTISLDESTLGRVVDLSERGYRNTMDAYNNKLNKLSNENPDVLKYYDPVGGESNAAAPKRKKYNPETGAIE